jgi:predicted ester cyclase
MKLPMTLVLLATASFYLFYFFGQGKPRIWDPDLRREYSTEPLAKTIIRQFDAYNMARGGRDDPITFRTNVERYMVPDMVYESVGFGNWKTPAGWARGEEHNYGMTFPETIFTQMLFFGDKNVSTTTTYGSALWKGDFLGVPASNTWVTLRITDFYHIRPEADGWGRIEYNFMMIDWADLMRQVGRPLLPPAPLPEGRVLPPDANDGVPAPLSVVVQAEGRDHVVANASAQAALHEWVVEGTKAKNWHADLVFFGPGGIGLARGSQEYEEHVLAPFHNAFTNRSVMTKLSACEGNYCAAFGEFHVKGVAPWLGLPTVGKKLAIRFGMHWRIVNGKAKEGWAIFDMPGLFSQLGLDFWKMASKAKAE